VSRHHLNKTSVHHQSSAHKKTILEIENSQYKSGRHPFVVRFQLEQPVVLTMEHDYFDGKPYWLLVHSASVFDSFIVSEPKRSYYDLFEGYPSNIEREQLSCSLQFHRVTMPYSGSSTKLLFLFWLPILTRIVLAD
jgi:hypothetical protein